MAQVWFLKEENSSGQFLAVLMEFPEREKASKKEKSASTRLSKLFSFPQIQSYRYKEIPTAKLCFLPQTLPIPPAPLVILPPSLSPTQKPGTHPHHNHCSELCQFLPLNISRVCPQPLAWGKPLAHLRPGPGREKPLIKQRALEIDCPGHSLVPPLVSQPMLPQLLCVSISSSVQREGNSILAQGYVKITPDEVHGTILAPQ